MGAGEHAIAPWRSEDNFMEMVLITFIWIPGIELRSPGLLLTLKYLFLLFRKYERYEKSEDMFLKYKENVTCNL